MEHETWHCCSSDLEHREVGNVALVRTCMLREVTETIRVGEAWFNERCVKCEVFVGYGTGGKRVAGDCGFVLRLDSVSYASVYSSVACWMRVG